MSGSCSPSGEPFPARDLTILLASSVILISLLAASIGLPRLLGGMHFPEEPAERQQEDMARRQAAAAAIAAIERAELALADDHHPDVLPQAAARVIALYEYRLNVAWSAEDQNKEHFRKLDRAERELRLAAMKAERQAIFDLARHHTISDETARRLVREIDLVEARHQKK
jgi:CPA1 family monovalent cation:H+ antiporter